MKKTKFVLALFSLPLLLTSCGGKGSDNSLENNIFTEAASWTNAQLLEKAKAETGDFYAYGNTSRIANAVENFIAAYPELGLDKNHAIGTKLKDVEIFTKVSSEYTAHDTSKNASLVLIQDSAQLNSYRKSTSMFVNYVNDSFRNNVAEDDLVPLVQQYTNKLFIWNNTAGESAPAFTNVWALTEAKYKDKIYFKSPDSEQVNMNFLITLTKDSWVKKMEEAYKAYYGKDYVKSADYKNASYEWIAKFLKNADTASYTSDTKMAQGVADASNSDKVGLFVLSKLRDSSVRSENLTVGAWTEQSITPFAGFMYAIFSQICAKAPRPYTAMLFTNYLMSSEGFAPWGGAIGAYSGNQSVKENENDKKNLAFYKQNLVVEDAEYINSVKVEVSDWLKKVMAA
ncbi:MAG: hypothetical protein PUC66_02245 [Erysipelotrichaceae bacterium]|nr:hypothetical protein [Erysipelotrichaceae bacterium]